MGPYLPQVRLILSCEYGQERETSICLILNTRCVSTVSSSIIAFTILERSEKGPIFSARFSSSGKWLLSCSLDGTACVWDVKGKKLQMQFRCHEGMHQQLREFSSDLI